ncbi:MAG: GAF domain-containing sensor histidine kinase [Smithellaceae bacterium]|nr:GAF domain-containing sensor histidine kinase [Smithellaceae bacterium]
MENGDQEFTANNYSHLPEEQELGESLCWLIRLRWIALACIFPVIWAGGFLFQPTLPQRELYLAGMGILLYNISFFLHHKRISRLPPGDATRRWTHFAGQQIYMDWFGLTVFIHLTGGIESPVMIYFLFHVVIASLVLPTRAAYLQPAIAFFMVGIIALLEYLLILKHVNLRGFAGEDNFRNPTYILGTLLFFATALFVITYLSTSIMMKLRQRTRSLIKLQEELRESAQRIETLYALTKSLTSTLDIGEVMKLITKNTAQLMRVKGCSVRLLDKTKKLLELHGAYGLSGEYLDKGPVHVSRSLLDAKEGQTVAIYDVATDPLVQYPAEAREERIFSMLGVPLMMKDAVIGVLRIHTNRPHEFTPEEKRFFTAIAGCVSIAVTNALAYQRIVELDEARSKLMLTVSHEMRAPVSAIQGMLGLLLEGYLGELSEKQQEIIGRTHARTESFIALINDLLDLGSDYLEQIGKAPATDTSLSECILKVVDLFMAKAGEKNLLIFTNLTEGRYTIKEQEGDMEKLFTNLVSNALKYTPPGGKITISTSEGEEYLSIVITDTGIGISADELPHIFEEFYRALNARKSGREGTGLGLPVVKNIVERYAGRIDVESRLAEGTKITVNFPWHQITK